MRSLIWAAIVGIFVWSALGIVIWGVLIPGIARNVDKPTDWALVEEFKSICAGILREIDNGKLVSDDLAFITGLSTASEGIDGPLLNRLMNNGKRWVILGGSGGTLTSLEKQLAPVKLSGIKPGSVVLAIHPSHLVDQPKEAFRLRENPFGRLKRRLENLTVAVTLRSFDNYLGHVRSGLYNFLYSIRINVHAVFGTEYTDYNAPANPWAQKVFLYHEDHAAPETLNFLIKRWHEYGWSNAEAYTGKGKETAAFRRLLRRFSAMGNDLTILLPPESQEFRALVPQDLALAQLKTHLRASGVKNVNVVDLRDSMAAEHFYDSVHLNSHGRAALTTILATKLKKIE